MTIRLTQFKTINHAERNREIMQMQRQQRQRYRVALDDVAEQRTLRASQQDVCYVTPNGSFMPICADRSED